MFVFLVLMLGGRAPCLMPYFPCLNYRKGEDLPSVLNAYLNEQENNLTQYNFKLRLNKNEALIFTLKTDSYYTKIFFFFF